MMHNMTEPADNRDLIEPPEYGPAMLALNERQRKFVVSLFDDDAPREGEGLWVYAARRAGFAETNRTPESLKSSAWRTAHNDRVVAAINEYAKMHVRTLSPEAVRSLKDLLKNPKHRDHMRAIDAVLNRTDPAESKLSVAVEQTWKPSAEVTEKVLRRIDELAAKFGLLPSPKVVDAEAVEVTP
jgi:hypothetical protein